VKVKLQAGASLDFVTPGELRAELSAQREAWRAELQAGGGYTRFTAAESVSGGTVEMGGPEREHHRLGPPQNYVWDVRRLRVTGLTGDDVVGIYVNEPSAATIIGTTADVSGALFLFDRNVILYPGESLLVAGSSLDATRITVSGQARELPTSLAWRL
jgi:hypothetical protein